MWRQTAKRARLLCGVVLREGAVPASHYCCAFSTVGSPGFVPPRSRFRLALADFLTIALPVTGAAVLGYGFMYPDEEPLFPIQQQPAAGGEAAAGQQQQEPDAVSNWSGTHTVRPKTHLLPETEADVERLVAEAHASRSRIRVAGQCLSPNGLSLSNERMLSMGLLDKVLRVDVEKQQVTVQAGVRVQQLADALQPYGLTLQNYASIREQQIGGFTQVGAHGTGAGIPPVDEQVVGMRLVTPGQGVLDLSAESDPDTFHMARVGLGALGVVTQFTLQCVPRHQLLEESFTTDRQTIRANHGGWLQQYQHLRYMWIPYTETVVVVRSNPVTPDTDLRVLEQPATHSRDAQLQPLRELLLHKTGAAPDAIESLGAVELRDALLAAGGCLDTDWVKRVNRAEQEYWRRAAGWRLGYSDEILGFECGGQQWVLEVTHPTGSLLSSGPSWWRRPRHLDLDFIQDLMGLIEQEDIAAPAPIEQRWTASSRSAMSPASCPPGTRCPPDLVHNWVGVIMYLPTDEEETRAAITSGFRHYSQLVVDRLMPKYNATWHWAKLEPPSDPAQLESMRQRLRARFPVERFNQLRARLDPHNVMANEWLDAVLPRQDSVS